MAYGYNGKILRVDLSRGEVSIEEHGDVFYRTYYGGRGLIGHVLLRENDPGADAFDPSNRLIFATGVFTGAPLAGSGRSSVGAKSPLTGGYGEAPVGGFWGAEFKRTGYDAIVVQGKAPEPVYLWVTDQVVEIREAAHIWGKPTAEAEETIKREVGDNSARVAQIGPAGEKLVRFAAVLNDVRHAAGRCGMGAVMGSKNLRAVVVRGHTPLQIADPEKVRSFAMWFADAYMDLSRGLYDLGTSDGVIPINRTGGLPTRNFREGVFEGAAKISGERMRDTMLVDRAGCFACPIRCKRVVEVKEPYEVSPIYGGPEYETIGALGSNCGVDDLAAIAKANELCNAYGLDTISTGVTVAFAMDCFENGLISEKETGGLKLSFGNAEAMVKLVEMIGKREGFGDLLAEGSARAARTLGPQFGAYAVHVKGQEVPMHDLRLKPGVGIGYAVSPTGADHLQSVHDTLYHERTKDLEKIQTLGILEPIPRADLGPGKVRLFTYGQHWNSMLNCIGLCIFLPYSYEQVVEMVGAITGWNCSLWELMKVGERGTTMARAFNVREGLGPSDDRIPVRLYQPHTKGPLAEETVDENEMNRAIRMYYGMMGWDSNGVPTEGKLQELGIEWVGECLPSSPSQ